MSACNVVLQRNAAHIITDGGKYLATGELVGIGLKCHALPHLPALLTLRGPNILSFLAEEIGSQFASYDEFLAGIEVALEQFVDKNSYLWDDAGQSAIELIFAGWSEARKRFTCYLLRTEDPGQDHIAPTDGGTRDAHTEPYRLLELPDGCQAPIVSEDMMKTVGMVASDGEQFDPIRDGRRLLEAQRALKLPLFEDEPPVCVVGGLAMLSTVTRDGTTQKVIHRWPDKIGEMMNENPITDWAAWRAAFVAEQVDSIAPEGVSRLKHEMLQKKAKKGKLRSYA